MPPIEVWEDTFRVNNRKAEYQYQPDIIGLSNGNFLVVWADLNDTTASSPGSDIVGQIYDPRGNEIGGEIFLNEKINNKSEAGWKPVAGNKLIYKHNSPPSNK